MNTPTPTESVRTALASERHNGSQRGIRLRCAQVQCESRMFLHRVRDYGCAYVAHPATDLGDLSEDSRVRVSTARGLPTNSRGRQARRITGAPIVSQLSASVFTDAVRRVDPGAWRTSLARAWRCSCSTGAWGSEPWFDASLTNWRSVPTRPYVPPSQRWPSGTISRNPWLDRSRGEAVLSKTGSMILRIVVFLVSV